jgi:hypothetical protein
MRKITLAVAAAAFFTYAVSAVQPAGAQQCPKGQSFDYGSQSCK